MARRPDPPAPPQPASRPLGQIRRGIERINRRIAELEEFDPQTVQKRWSPEVTVLQNAIDEALTAAFGHNTVEYRRYAAAIKLDNGPMFMELSPYVHTSSHHDLHRVRQYLAEGKQASLLLLRQAVKGLEEEVAELELESTAALRETGPQRNLNKVFLVHGHDEAALQAVARFLEHLDLAAIVLREQPDQGRTIIEKFEDCVEDVGFAVVLLTPDDIARAADTPQEPNRARQNVIFELGYFAGKLGRGRACLIRKGTVEIPSDLYGVIYTELDTAGGWKLKLVQEMKAAKLDFDANRVWG